MSEAVATPTRCGFVAVLGAPNVGKSTLVNRLVGAKVSIVSPKVQTTRSRIVAIAMAGPVQAIFVDTPGIFRPRHRLERAMVDAAWGGAEHADLLLLLVDATRGLDRDSRAIVDALTASGRRAVLALNKVDAVRRESLLDLATRCNATGAFTDILMISALTGDGVDDLQALLARRLPEGPWLYPEDQIADVAERFLASEITREQVFLQLRDELPYAITVETETWKELKDGSVRMDQTIFVRRDSQKAIVLGKAGRQLRRIGEMARAEMAAAFDRPVHLFLFVKVRENWQEDPERYRQMGLDYAR